jgi:hypothetical protein
LNQYELTRSANKRVQFLQLCTFQINGTADTQYLAYMRPNLINNISIHFEAMASGSLKEMRGLFVELLLVGNRSLAIWPSPNLLIADRFSRAAMDN